MSECLGAGTGCGWCIPVLCQIVRAVAHQQEPGLAMTPEEYAAARIAYRADETRRHNFRDEVE